MNVGIKKYISKCITLVVSKIKLKDCYNRKGGMAINYEAGICLNVSICSFDYSSKQILGQIIIK